MPAETTLAAISDRVLLASLRPEFKQVIDRLLARGDRREMILDYVRATARHFAASRDREVLTILAVDACCDSRTSGGQQ